MAQRLGSNRADQYDIVHAMHWEKQRDVRWNEMRDVAMLECGIRLVTSDTAQPVNCFNCLTGARDWKCG